MSGKEGGGTKAVQDKVPDEESELSRNRKVNKKHGRRQGQNENLTALINFRLPEISRPTVVQKRFSESRRKTVFNRDQYLKAVYQFAFPVAALNSVADETDFTWDAILQVRLFDNDKCLCPICLSDPAAARITRCGHIFCYPCLLRHFAYKLKACLCPVCATTISQKQLKSARIFPVQKYSEGQEMKFTLMRRRKHLDARVETADGIPVEAADIRCFVEDVVDFKSAVYEGERDQLEHRLAEDELDEEEISIGFDVEALRRLENDMKDDGLDSTDASCYQSDFFPSRMIVGDENDTQDNFAYFYQSADCQRIYLHPLNVLSLVFDHKAVDQCPRTITGRIIVLESNFLNHDLKKQYRYLNHLPIGAEFKFAELDLKHLISKQSACRLEPKLTARRKKEAEVDKELSKRREIAEKIMCEHYNLQNTRVEPISATTVVPPMEAFPAMPSYSSAALSQPKQVPLPSGPCERRSKQIKEQNPRALAEKHDDDNLLSSLCMQALANMESRTEGKQTKTRKKKKQRCSKE